MQFTQGATRKRGLCKRAWACVQKDALGCVRIRRGKSVPVWHVGVCANLCESNHVARRLCVSACGRVAARGECGKLEEAKRASVHVNELKKSLLLITASRLCWCGNEDTAC